MLLLWGLTITLFCLCVLWEKRFESLLAPFACAALLLGYALAMARALSWFGWIACISAACCLALTARRAAKSGLRTLIRAFGKNVITPGLLCFVLILALTWAGGMEHTVTATDDIHYWGIEPLSLFAHNGLVNSDQHLSPRFMTYTPGMQLFQWIGLNAYGEWNEGILYCTLWATYAVFLLPLTERIRWKKAYWIPVFVLFALGFPTLFNGDAYTMLRVDTVLGLCLGYSLIQAWAVGAYEKERGFHLACMALSLCAMVLIKQVGIAWNLMTLSLLLFVVKPYRRYGLKRAPVVLACLAPIAIYASWKVFCALNHLSGVHLNRLSNQIQAILSGNWSVPDGLGAMLASVFTKSYAVADGALLHFPIIVWVLGLVLFPLVQIGLHGEKKRTMRALCIWSAVCFVGFVLGYIASLLTAFTDAEGQSAILYAEESFRYFLTLRYFCPFLICVSMLLGSMTGIRATQPGVRTGIRICAAALLVLCCGWRSVYQNLVPSAYAQIQVESPFITELSENFWVDDLEEPENAVVLYGIQSTPFKLEHLQYAVAPIKLVLCTQEELSDESFISLLQEKHITHIVCMDEENTVFQNALNYTEDTFLDLLTVYTVQWDGNVPSII